MISINSLKKKTLGQQLLDRYNENVIADDLSPDEYRLISPIVLDWWISQVCKPQSNEEIVNDK